MAMVLVYPKLTVFSALLLAVLSGSAQSFVSPLSQKCNRQTTLASRHLMSNGENGANHEMDRRAFVSFTLTASTLSLAFPQTANAGIDPSALRNIQVEGDNAGSATRLRQIEAVNKPETDLADMPFIKLPSGVSYREYRAGKGEAVVQAGSKVAVEMTIRCKSFSTANDSGGVKYYSTKDDEEFNELAFVVGSGEMAPGLEEGLMGMHKNALRRIEVPSTMVFSAKKEGQLPLPQTKEGKRRFESLFKTDATLLFEVLVTRIK